MMMQLIIGAKPRWDMYMHTHTPTHIDEDKKAAVMEGRSRQNFHVGGGTGNRGFFVVPTEFTS